MPTRTSLIDGNQYNIWPLTLGQMRKYGDALAALSQPSANPFTQMAAMLPLFAECLGVTEDVAGSVITKDNFGAFARAILGDGGAPGETQPGAQTGS